MVQAGGQEGSSTQGPLLPSPAESPCPSGELTKGAKKEVQQTSTVYVLEPEAACGFLFFPLCPEFLNAVLYSNGVGHDVNDHLRDMFERKMALRESWLMEIAVP